MKQTTKRTKAAEIMDELEAGIAAVFESDAYKQYLEFVGKFRHYSWANCMLIMIQAPSTSYVASYTDWKTKFNRYVKKGSKSIRILAPHTINETDDDGTDRTKIGFHAASVFPIEATAPIEDDKEAVVPDLCQPLDFDVDRFEDLRDVLVDISPVPLSFEVIQGNAFGYFSPSEKKIVVKAGLSEAQTIKTMLHEIAHSWLHCKGGECEKADRYQMETQAESIAYSVSSWLGIDTGEYSFPYLASWSKDKALPELQASLAVIQKTAVKMMDLIEERLM